MSVCTYYQERLSGLNLAFEESVYAIAFNLMDKIRREGKDLVFYDLPSPGRMTERVQEVLGDTPAYNYVLRKVLGYPVCSDDEEAFNATGQTITECFCAAVDYLQGGICRVTYGDKSPVRYVLVGRVRPWAEQEKTSSLSDNLMSPVSLDGPSGVVVPRANVSVMLEQLQELVDEVLFHSEKCEEGLASIKALLAELKSADTTLADATAETSTTAQATDGPAGTTDLQEVDDLTKSSLANIPWSRRSWDVFRDLKIGDMNEAVRYFSCFDNFIDSNGITLWEWCVICATLRRYGQMTTNPMEDVDLSDLLDLYSPALADQTSDLLFDASITFVGSVVDIFACGAKRGWDYLSSIGFDDDDKRFLADMIGSWEVVIAPELCIPTTESPTRALGFQFHERRLLNMYRISTIGELMAACRETNRFFGLRYLNESLYEESVERLRQYGFKL